MSSDNLKELKREKEREIKMISRKIQGIKGDIETIDLTVDQLRRNLNDNIKLKKTQAQAHAVQSALTPLEDELTRNRRDLDSLHATKEQLDSAAKSEESLYDEFLQKDSVLLDIKKASDEIRNSISENVGNRFSEAYVSNLASTTITMDETNMQALLDKFEDLKDRMRDKRSSSSEFLTKVEGKVKEFSSDKVEGDLKGASKLLGAMSVVMVITAPLTFPLYLGYLVTLATRNIKQGAIYSRTLIECKAVMDNFDTFDQSLRDKAKEKYLQNKEKVEKEFNAKKTTLEDNIKQLQSSLLQTRTEALTAFSFNDTPMREQASREIEDWQIKKKNMQDDIVKLTSQWEALRLESLELSGKMASYLDTLKDKYLRYSENDKSLIFEEDFLLDIVDGAAVMFKYPLRNSAVFIYDNLDSAINFIKLIIIQTRARMNPHSLRLQLWDTDTMGIDFASFVDKKTELFKIVSSKSDIGETVEKTATLLAKRNDTVRRSLNSASDGLNEYNEKMISLDSLTESYQLSFLLGLDNTLLSNEQFNQIVKVGPGVGLYTNIFLPLDRMDDSFKSLFENNVQVYSIMNGKVNTKAQTWAMETFGKPER